MVSGCNTNSQGRNLRVGVMIRVPVRRAGTVVAGAIMIACHESISCMCKVSGDHTLRVCATAGGGISCSGAAA